MVNRNYSQQEQNNAVSRLKIELINGENLLAADNGGLLGTGAPETSDPFVIFKQGYAEKKSNYISKTLNPEWNEKFELLILDGAEKLTVEVKDRDTGRNDDLGVGEVDLKQVPAHPAPPKDFVVALTGPGQATNNGKIHLRLQIEGSPVLDSAPTQAYQLADQLNSKRVLQVQLEKGENIVVGSDPKKLPDTYVVLKQGLVQATSLGAFKTISPSFNDQKFDIPVLDSAQPLSLKVFDKNLIGLAGDVFFGAAFVDISGVGDQPKDFAVPVYSPGLVTPNSGILYLKLNFKNKE